ncbi:MAG: non-heme iron oxygenase ferredoxin subunit [Ferrimicrobium sp.]|uniref:non-heme iron oxygenase ferredoxin subunit n=1 Tax=Ferrimicrobium sp. TaxID=2926050 RepID=UPI00261BB467|nr:non-heme iron oxygenase ferredoxin subunit [Ferrimicrobium sp.]
MDRIGATRDFEEGKPVKVDFNGFPVVVVRIDGELFAIGDTCSHAKYSLSEGEVYAEEREIECWKHGSTFSLRDGHPTCFPATKAVPVFEVVERTGEVFLEAPADSKINTKRS